MVNTAKPVLHERKFQSLRVVPNNALIVFPCLTANCFNISAIFCAVAESNPVVGSSRNNVLETGIPCQQFTSNK